LLRERGLQMPVIVLSARGLETDKMRALELGADDYVTKPFSIIELQARIRAALRRASGLPMRLEICRFGGIEVNFRLMRATKGKRSIPLSGLEFEVLRYLVLRRGEVVSRDSLLHDVWRYQQCPMTRSVDNVVARLRHKLEAHPEKPNHILTVYGLGYRFVE
jgi:two-component system alkaline phosphatase synthesis response regulator PhoP